jgi:hypothetical protein
MVFLIDLPRLSPPAATHASAARNHAPTRFYTELVYFLQATGVGEKMVASLANYDFSRTANIAFVHTMYVFFAPFAESFSFGQLLLDSLRLAGIG